VPIFPVSNRLPDLCSYWLASAGLLAVLSGSLRRRQPYTIASLECDASGFKGFADDTESNMRFFFAQKELLVALAAT
jgi:hypothetical protein